MKESQQRLAKPANSGDSTDESIPLKFFQPASPSRCAAKSRIIFQSPCMIELINTAQRYANSMATVLITGESGTGKELFAQLIHESGNRHANRYGRANCAALSENLMESELFGHERGAFTGAFEQREGWFEYVQGGTLLLDEISEISVNLQAKLLRVLEEGEFQRVGSNVIQTSDVRVIATSNRNLHEQVTNREFRADLYYRLNVLSLHLPPLRQRPKDIPLLANHFVNLFKHENAVELKGLSAHSMKLICEYGWPGNIRQLRNVIHRACVISDSPEIQPHHLSGLGDDSNSLPDSITRMSLEQVERLMILRNLERFSGSRTKVAEQLGITTRTLGNKLNQYREAGWIEPVWIARAG